MRHFQIRLSINNHNFQRCNSSRAYHVHARLFELLLIELVKNSHYNKSRGIIIILNVCYNTLFSFEMCIYMYSNMILEQLLKLWTSFSLFLLLFVSFRILPSLAFMEAPGSGSSISGSMSSISRLLLTILQIYISFINQTFLTSCLFHNT